ncbi:MAG: hypothetical protein K6E50_02335 [Lachnospiraceae bacterium]|nr:hypothetical protein [Lachnospiraceae bacterium]
MVNIYQCVGRYASAPLVIRNSYIRVWCLEELCYYICENADLLDDSFPNNELLDWLADECGLRDLSQRLKVIRRQSVKLESFVLEILNEAHYVDEEEGKRIARVIRANRTMPETERVMVLADYFLRGGHLSAALSAYEALLRKETDGPDDGQRSRIWCNMGVVYARLFCFREAADLYARAYELSGDGEALFGYLAAMRMQLSDSEYLKFVSEYTEDNTIPAELEERLQQIRRDHEETDADARLDALRRMRIGSERNEYTAAARELLEEAKVGYRKAVSE